MYNVHCIMTITHKNLVKELKTFSYHDLRSKFIKIYFWCTFNANKNYFEDKQ